MTLINVLPLARTLFRKCTRRKQTVMSYHVWPEGFIDYWLRRWLLATTKHFTLVSRVIPYKASKININTLFGVCFFVCFVFSLMLCFSLCYALRFGRPCLNELSSPFLPGPPARHSDGRLSAVHSEHLWRDPLPQDDLAGGDRGCHRDLHHRLHVLHHCESAARCDWPEHVIKVWP